MFRDKRPTQETIFVPGRPADYLYYANGWLKEVQENSASIAEYIYDEVGNRTRVELGNDAYTTYDYHSTDPRYFVSEIEHFQPDDQSIGAITYSQRDDSGNPTSVTYPGGAVSYTYDVNNRLVSESSSSFGYDWVGNRLNPPADPSPMVYDDTDKLVTWPGEHQYTYYPTGSLYQQKNSQGSVQKTFTYTGAELLESVTHAGVNDPSEMEWDGDANRVSFTRSTTPIGTWYFVYDTTAGIPAVIEENDGDPVYYIREPNGALIARVDGATTNYYHFDALGSTRLLTNGSGTVTDTYTYDAWGKQTASTGPTAQPYRYVGQLGYYSHYQDENLFDQSGYQFLQLGVRFYDALTGRFTQRDPAKDGLNCFVHASDDPLGRVDPSGLACTAIERAVRDDALSLVPAPTLVRHLRTEHSWKQVGYEPTWGIAWGSDNMVGCNCIWQRSERSVDLWKRLEPMKQKMSCQTWGPCGYGGSWTYWRHFVRPVFYEHAGDWRLLPRLSLQDTRKTPGFVILTSTGEDCLCRMPQ
ncbi:MAG: RHS repeat-associated core domain-containing protein [Armatimonadetes bacterium]|nr:RHS repeat-associated core domain-containing protein [Armatimonadota bacterium]